MDYGKHTDTQQEQGRDLHKQFKALVERYADNPKGLKAAALQEIHNSEKDWNEDQIIHSLTEIQPRIDNQTITTYNAGEEFSELKKDPYNITRDGLITIGGEANTGKTSLVTQYALRLLEKNEDMIFLFYSLDDSEFLSSKRILSQIRGVNCFKTDPEEYKNMESYQKKIMDRIFIREHININSIQQDINIIQRQTGGDKHFIIAIDYLQAIPVPGDVTVQREFYNAVISQLKTLQKDTGYMILLLSQLNRNTNSSTYRYRETSEIENQSDVCIDITYPNNDKDVDKSTSSRNVTISKNKLGMKGTTFTTRIDADGGFLFSRLSKKGTDKQGEQTAEKIVKNKKKTTKKDIL